jgi:hypothetical protein
MPTLGDYVEKACNPTATADDLLALYGEVERRGLLGAPAVDDTGEAISLGDLIKAKGRAARARATQQPPAADDSEAVPA